MTRVPGLADGDEDVHQPQDRGCDDGLRLCGRELAVLPAGQGLVPGPVDRVGALRGPDRAPRCQPAAAGRAWPVSLVRPVHAPERFCRAARPACLTTARAVANPRGVAGLGQDRRRAYSRQPGDQGASAVAQNRKIWRDRQQISVGLHNHNNRRLGSPFNRSSPGHRPSTAARLAAAPGSADARVPLAGSAGSSAAACRRRCCGSAPDRGQQRAPAAGRRRARGFASGGG
jgi:hypothetical protein